MKLFAARGPIVTGFFAEIDHSQSCHRPGAARKYQTGERDTARSNQSKLNRG